jgi:nucleotide-binding universal stress UspA family protein
MSNNAQGRVIVGVDNAYAHHPIIDLAVAEARRLGTGVTIIHIVVDPAAFGLGPWALGLVDAAHDATIALEKLAVQVREENPDVDVKAVVSVGLPAATLIDLSRQAELIVVGCRGMGGFAELLLGSVSSQVAAHAHSPVIVVRPADSQTADARRPVLVGVDGSPANDAAIGFAFAEAAQRGTHLIAMHYWSPVPTLVFVDEYTQAQLAQDEEKARALLSEALAGWQEKYPGVVVEQRLTLDANPEDAFIQISAEVSLVVVGSRGRGGFTGLMLGSVSQALLHHAHCPVAVVRP